MKNNQTICKFLVFLVVLFVPFGLKAQSKDTLSKESSCYHWQEMQSSAEKDPSTKKTVIGQSVGTLSIGCQKNPYLGFLLTVAHANDHGSPWGETTANWSFAPNDKFSFAVGAGVEHFDERNLRGRVNIFYDHNHDFCYAQYDYGRGASWGWLDCMQFGRSSVGVGVLAQLPDQGVGPKLEIRAGDNFSIWGAYVRQVDGTKAERVIVGLRIKHDF